MAVQRTIRVIRTWDVVVDAEYGDTDSDLKNKVSEDYLDGSAPSAESRVILEASNSEYDTFEEWENAQPAEEI